MIQLGNDLRGRGLLSLLQYMKIFRQLNDATLVLMLSSRTSWTKNTPHSQTYWLLVYILEKTLTRVTLTWEPSFFMRTDGRIDRRDNSEVRDKAKSPFLHFCETS